MRIALMWPSPQKEVATLIADLKKDGHEIVYFVGDGTEACNPAGSIYHDHYDAWDGVRAPALVDANIAPLREADIIAHYRLESLVLTMMNKHFDQALVDERKHLYYELLAYWKFVLEKTKPDAVLFQIVPHSIYNYIMFELAKEDGIRTFMFEESVFEGRLMPYQDFRAGSEELRTALKENLLRGVTLVDLDREIQDHVLSHRKSAQETSAPWYMREQKTRVSGRGLWNIRARAFIRSLSSGSTLRLVVSYIARRLRTDLQGEYRRVMRSADYAKRYVYFPLQFQPERTSSPQGDMYHDQLLAIETLSAALPEDWEIYVKEHPSQWLIRTKTRYNSVRWRGYYEQISRIARTRLIPIETNTYELSERSETVAVISGSAAWESLLRGKQPLVFGWVWYRDCPGVHFVRSVEDCTRALSAIKTAQFSERDMFAFLKAFEDVSVRTHMAQSAASPRLSAQEGTHAMTQVLLRELRNG